MRRVSPKEVDLSVFRFLGSVSGLSLNEGVSLTFREGFRSRVLNELRGSKTQRKGKRICSAKKTTL